MDMKALFEIFSGSSGISYIMVTSERQIFCPLKFVKKLLKKHVRVSFLLFKNITLDYMYLLMNTMLCLFLHWPSMCGGAALKSPFELLFT